MHQLRYKKNVNQYDQRGDVFLFVSFFVVFDNLMRLIAYAQHFSRNRMVTSINKNAYLYLYFYIDLN